MTRIPMIHNIRSLVWYMLTDLVDRLLEKLKSLFKVTI